MSDSHREDPNLSSLDARLTRLYSSLPSFGKAGWVLDGYKLQRLIGRGSFGDVYLAVELSTQLLRAVKILRGHLVDSDEACRRFIRESELVCRWDHPNIVQGVASGVYFDPDSGERFPYLVTEFLDGGSLDEWLHSRGTPPFTDEELVAFLIPLLSAVAYAHSHGVLHRDIKPSNILLEAKSGKSADGRSLNEFVPKLGDFGLAKNLENRLNESVSSAMVGTPVYMAPEQLLPHWGEVSERSDVYSVGLVLYELIHRKRYRTGRSHAELMLQLLDDERRTTWNSRKFFDATTARPLDRIVGKCLAVDPLDRYASAEQLMRVLHDIANGRSARSGAGAWLGQRVFARWARRPQTQREACRFIVAMNLIYGIWFVALAARLIASQNSTAAPAVAALCFAGLRFLVVYFSLLALNRTYGWILLSLVLIVLGESLYLAAIFSERFGILASVYAPSNSLRFLVHLLFGTVQVVFVIAGWTSYRLAKARASYG